MVAVIVAFNLFLAFFFLTNLFSLVVATFQIAFWSVCSLIAGIWYIMPEKKSEPYKMTLPTFIPEDVGEDERFHLINIK